MKTFHYQAKLIDYRGPGFVTWNIGGELVAEDIEAVFVWLKTLCPFAGVYYLTVRDGKRLLERKFTYEPTTEEKKP